MKNPKTIAKFNAFIADLVSKFGEGTIVSHKELDAFWKTGPDGKYPNIVSIRKNPDYLVTRGKYVITASPTPAKVRDEILATQAVAAEKSSHTKLDKAVRTSATALAKTILATKKVDLPKEDAVLDADYSTEDDDVNDILRVHNNT